VPTTPHRCARRESPVQPGSDMNYENAGKGDTVAFFFTALFLIFMVI
jgi:hypothetical protein